MRKMDDNRDKTFVSHITNHSFYINVLKTNTLSAQRTNQHTKNSYPLMTFNNVYIEKYKNSEEFGLDTFTKLPRSSVNR